MVKVGEVAGPDPTSLRLIPVRLFFAKENLENFHKNILIFQILSFSEYYHFLTWNVCRTLL